MRLLTHRPLDTQQARAQFAQLQQAVAQGDFKSPNFKKLSPTPYWRFKLDQTPRLLVHAGCGIALRDQAGNAVE